MQNVVDKIKLVKLPEPVEVFLGFNTAPLPDAIETLLYRVTDAGFAPMPMEVSAQ